MNLKKMISLLLGLMLALVPAAWAEDESEAVFCITGLVTGMAPDSLSIRWEDGNVYTFPVASRVDTSMLSGALGVGRVVTLYYTGTIDWEAASSRQTQVFSVEDGTLDYPYGVLVYDESADVPQRLQLDLDQDGMIDTISLSSVSNESLLQVNEFAFSDTLLPYFLMVCDLDPEDGCLDMFLTLKSETQEFSCIRLQYREKNLHTMDILSGIAADFMEGYIVLTERIRLLGGCFYADSYVCLDESGALVHDAGSLWNLCQYQDMDPVTLLADLPVVLLTVDGEMERMLPAGTPLLLSATDQKETVWFETENGESGYFSIQTNENGQTIAGQAANRFFSLSPLPANTPPYSIN